MLGLQSCIVHLERFTRFSRQGLKALSGADFATIVLSWVFNGACGREASAPTVRLRCAREIEEVGGWGAGSCPRSPLTPCLFFLGFSESTKGTLHQLVVGKRQRPAADFCAPQPRFG